MINNGKPVIQTTDDGGVTFRLAALANPDKIQAAGDAAGAFVGTTVQSFVRAGAGFVGGFFRGVSGGKTPAQGQGSGDAQP